MVSKKWFDRLPKELQDVVTAEARALIPVRLQWTYDYSKESLDKILTHKDVQYYKLTKAEWAGFREASLSVHRKYAELNGEKGARFLEQIKAKVQEVTR